MPGFGIGGFRFGVDEHLHGQAGTHRFRCIRPLVLRHPALDVFEEGRASLPEEPAKQRQRCAIELQGHDGVVVETLFRRPGQVVLERADDIAHHRAQALDGCRRVTVLSVATDGLDGSSGAAGAVVSGETLARARAAGLSAHRALAENDSAPFFLALGDLWITGASGTNVNDLAIALAYPMEA